MLKGSLTGSHKEFEKWVSIAKSNGPKVKEAYSLSSILSI